MSLKILILGLGNPGFEYEGTRHNVGFSAIDYLKKMWKTPLSFYENFVNYGAKDIVFKDSESNEILFKFILAKPLTFMNLSGKAAQYLIKKFEVDPLNLIVIYDDIDLPIGYIRIRKDGGSAGHKGIISLIDSIHTNDFIRIRIGIGRPKQKDEVINYVLSGFSRAEEKEIEEEFFKLNDVIKTILLDGVSKAQLLYNKRVKEE